MSDTTETVQAVDATVERIARVLAPHSWRIYDQAIAIGPRNDFIMQTARSSIAKSQEQARAVLAALTAAPAPAVVSEIVQAGDLVERLSYELHCLEAGGRQYRVVEEALAKIICHRHELAAATERAEKAERERDILAEDRARFPDKPDGVGRMIEAHIGNLKAGKEASEQHAHRALDKVTTLTSDLEKMRRALEEAVEYVRDGVRAQERNLHDVEGYPNLMAREQKTLDACLADLRLVESALAASRADLASAPPAPSDALKVAEARALAAEAALAKVNVEISAELWDALHTLSPDGSADGLPHMIVDGLPKGLRIRSRKETSAPAAKDVG